MSPEYQTWQKGEAVTYLQKNHGGGGYFVDVQGSQEVKNILKAKFDDLGEAVYCQWNSGSDLAGLLGEGKILTIRTRNSETVGGATLLELVGQELKKLGFERTEE
jgi:hypothetical protein